MRRIKQSWTAVILIYSIFLVVPPSILAVDNGALPFSFSSGTPAKASEVNQNFQYVNYGNVVLIDGTGAELGTWIGRALIGPGLGEKNGYLNKNGYIVWLEGGIPGNVIKIYEDQLYYTTSNCTGNAYMNTQGQSYSIYLGSLFSNNGLLYYLPKNAGLPVTINFNSYLGLLGVGCQQQTGVAPESYQVFINDPSVTGESSVIKTLPLRIIRRTP